MKLIEVLSHEQHQRYVAWQRACRAQFPNCTFVGNQHQGQAVDWMSKNNEVAGDWQNGEGIVYKPGSLGREVVERI